MKIPLKIPSYVSYTNGQSVTNYYKSVTNFMNIQCVLFANNVYISYYTNKRYETLTYAQVDHMATLIACQLIKDTRNVETLSFVGDHSADYLITMLAILKLRIPMLAISPRTSEAAAVNLLNKTSANLLIVTSNYKSMADCLSAQCSNLKTIVLQPLDFNRLLKEPIDPNHVHLLDYEFSDDDIKKTALIFHTSGSTSLPKPNYLSNLCLFNIMSPYHKLISAENGLRNLDENDTTLTCAPLYHSFGIFPILGASYIGGKVVFMEKLQSSQEEIHFALEYNKCTIMAAPPIVYEQMINYLKKTKDFSTVNRLLVASFGGAPLKYESGDWLQRHGVNVRDMYGSTETGGSMSSNLDPSFKDWESVRPFLKDDDGEYYHIFETEDESEPDIKHLYIRGDSPNLATGVANRADGGYDTNDLFRQSLEFPGYYKYVGRRDDLIILENGKKTDPLAMEASIRQDPIIQQAAVIGHGRQCTAALIELNMDYAQQFSPEEIISAVHLAIKRANKECFYKHSIILPQMVKILPIDKKLPFTDKGTVMRKKAELQYMDMVDKLYKDLLQEPSISFDKRIDTLNWTYEQVESFIISCAVKVLGVADAALIDKSQSFFHCGLNSLTSIQFRHLIAEYFDNVPLNFLYQYTSVESVCKALTSKTEERGEQVERRYQQTQQLAIDYIERAKRDYPAACTHTYSGKQDRVILLTGVTGSLGSFILRDLLLDSSVKKVYVMIRGKPEQRMARLIQAFESRFLDTSLLKNERVIVLPMQLDEPFLGLGDERYFELKKEVNVIQHCGWLLDFNMTIDHYDKECIAPFYNLIRFGYRQVNPMHVHFISSISASAGYSNGAVPEEALPLDSHVAMPMGYAQSKFVVEILFNYLMTEKKFPCYVERVSQICGDSMNGVWNTSEQYPLMLVGGGSKMHKMPDLDIMVDWITVDDAAASITEIMLKTAHLSANKDQSVYHIVNPRPVKWIDMLESVKETGMKFEIVSPFAWLDALAKDETNPAFKLIGFYQENFSRSRKMPIWETHKTAAVTSVINKAPAIDSRLLSKFFDQWQSVGFYKPGI